MITKAKHCVYDITYHIVLVVKYRKKVITKEMGKYLCEEAKRLVSDWNGTVIEANTDLDHMHLLVSAPPSVCMSDKIGSLKNRTSRTVKEAFPEELEGKLYGMQFWSDSFFISSVGGANEEVIQEYIRKQGEPKRKYVRRFFRNSP